MTPVHHEALGQGRIFKIQTHSWKLCVWERIQTVVN